MGIPEIYLCVLIELVWGQLQDCGMSIIHPDENYVYKLHHMVISDMSLRNSLINILVPSEK